jgi:outer membrane usher protein
MAKFATKVGYQALITLRQRNGEPVPFGAMVTAAGDGQNEQNSGITGDAGQVYMSGLPEQGALQVKWGQDATRQCKATYSLKDIPAPSANNPVRSLTIRCQ